MSIPAKITWLGNKTAQFIILRMNLSDASFFITVLSSMIVREFPLNLIVIFLTFIADAFARVIGGHNVKETQVILQTRSPTWDQMLKFKEVVLWGEAAEIYVNPPIIVVEIYDKDPGVSCVSYKICV